MAFARRHLGTLLALGGGFAAFLALAVPPLWPLAFLGVAGYLASALRSSSSRSALARGLLFGIAASMGGIWWFWDALPLSWLQVPEGAVQAFLVGVVYALTVLALALPFALLAPLIRFVPDRWYRPLAFALAYMGIEELRMWSFALFFLAPEAALAPNFSIGGMGYALAESRLFLPLALGGHYALNGFVGLAAGTALSRTRASLAAGLAALALSLALAHGALPAHDARHSLRAGLVSTYLPPGPFEHPSLIIEELREAGAGGAQVIVLPEGFGLAPFMDEETRRSLYASVFGGDGLVMSSSVVREEDGDERAELLYETAEAGVIGFQDKIFFVPVGEYLPPLVRAGISLAGEESLNGYGSYIAGRAVAGSALRPATHEGVRFGALLCSELLSPRLYAGIAAEGTGVLVNLANNSWFHGSRLLHARLVQIAKVHAVRNRQPLLVAANGSPAFAVGPRGDVIDEAAWGEAGVLFVDIPLP